VAVLSHTQAKAHNFGQNAIAVFDLNVSCPKSFVSVLCNTAAVSVVVPRSTASPRGAIFTASALNRGVMASVSSNVSQSCLCLKAPKV